MNCLVLAPNRSICLELIVHEYTGFLLPLEISSWFETLTRINREDSRDSITEASVTNIDREMICDNAKQRVKTLYGMEVFKECMAIILSNIN